MSAEAQQHYQQMSLQIGQIRQKVSELEGEKYEHELVVKALESMDDDRKCYRLIGGVLVQRTKKEVFPAVTTNLEQIGQLIERLKEELIMLEQASIDFRNELNAKMQQTEEDKE